MREMKAEPKGEGAMEKQPVLEIRQLTKEIGKKTIVEDLSLQVQPGEVFGFLGPNGAGKTTTIRMLVGLMSITRGKVLIQGIDLEEHFEKAIAHVGAIVENPELYPFLTGYQNLLHYWRMSRSIPKDRIDEVVQRVGLEQRIHHKVKTYSLGMRQRLGLAQALLHSPSLLILDEPTNGLDPAGIRDFRNQLRTWAREENLSVLVSSHLLSEVELMCDRVAVIQQGKLIDVKQVRELVDDTDEEQTFLLDVHPSLQALTQLQKRFPHREVEIIDNRIQLPLQRSEVPELSAWMVQQEIQIYTIQPVTRTLEDRFLQLTGGSQLG